MKPEDYNIIDRPIPSLIDQNLLPQPDTFSLHEKIPKHLQEKNRSIHSCEQLGYSILVYLQTGPYYVKNSQPEEIYNEINQKT